MKLIIIVLFSMCSYAYGSEKRADILTNTYLLSTHNVDPLLQNANLLKEINDQKTNKKIKNHGQ